MEKLIQAVYNTINKMEDTSYARVDGYDITIHSNVNGNITFSADLFNEIVKMEKYNGKD